MGYTLAIGNAVFAPVDDEWSDHYDEGSIHIEPVELADAPALDAVNPRANVNWPSYSAVAERARTLGLHDLFFADEGGLLRPHPGVVRLRGHHADRLSTTLARLRAEHPDVEPRYLRDDEYYLPNEDGSPITFCKNGGLVVHDAAAEKRHAMTVSLAWLTWVEFWARWAVSNCERPAIKNT